ncbi:Protein CBG15162 [Caenorhabditis briggsae]|uniref:F-box associated domain-containing protein n=4 Tax=Caenorhabditis briggsae TaxID=6238 RepID=A0AAE9D8I8_CAEBR|nr:Protein CBG15162 [Caenorhabditis briggsae]ULT98538.1 hypothetical protein L3Y34_000124 [Caenorhabditis briggsae]CAP33583.1 Protein CBG15162 [Caenorhabditis briggsae]
MENSNPPSSLSAEVSELTPSEDKKMKPDFRLMDLYMLEQRTMLKNWTLNQQISYSLCSKKCKDLIQSLGQKFKFNFFVSKHLEIEIYKKTDRFLRANIEYCPEKQEVKFSSPDDRKYKFELNFKMSLKAFLEHLRTIYGCNTPNLMFREELESLDMIELKDAMSGFQISNMTILNTVTSDSFSKALDFYTSPKRMILAVNRRDFPFSEFNSGFKGKQFEIVKVMEYPLEQLQLFRSVISKYIEIDCLFCNPWMFNLVLKDWINGEGSAWRDHLEALYLRFNKSHLPDNYEEVIIDGIEFQRESLQKQPYDVPHFDDNEFWELSNEMHARFGIRRVTDGKKATVILDSFKNSFYFKLIIGH